MADNYSICLVAAMDRLWFRQIILFSEPTSKSPNSTSQDPLPCTSSSADSSSKHLLPLVEEQPANPIPPPQDGSKTNPSNEDEENKAYVNQEPRRKRRYNSHVTNHYGTRSSSSSPSSKARPKNFKTQSLPTSPSYMSLSDLEIQELKGFMDLGFKFSKEHINPRIMRVLPGLRRLRISEKENADADSIELHEEDGNERPGVVRPYLSEAWLIGRPDSPLLNLKVPRAREDGDMKKHIVFWARTVASVVKQES